MDNPDRPLVLVDSSYFSIKRATALMSWWGRAHPDDPKKMNHHLPWVLNSVYMTKYTELYKRNIDNICKHFGVRHEDILFARDCPRSEIWRCSIYPQYKGTRNSGHIDPATLAEIESKIRLQMETTGMDPSWQTLQGQELSPTTLGMGPVIKHNNDTFLKSNYVRLMRIDSAEADDVVAVIAQRVRQLQPDRRIIIVANDQDYMQLHDPKLEVVELSAKFKNIRKGDLTGEEYLLHKIIGGDSSDNIPSCGVSAISGVRSAKDLALDPDLLATTLEANEGFRKQFELNQRLVDFRKMPQELQDLIWKEFLKVAPEFQGMVASAPATASAASTPIIQPRLPPPRLPSKKKLIVPQIKLRVPE